MPFDLSFIYLFLKFFGLETNVTPVWSCEGLEGYKNILYLYERAFQYEHFLRSVLIQILARDTRVWVRYGMAEIRLFLIYFIRKNMEK